RLSTVYMPGRKFTMLPDDAVAKFTLAKQSTPPALSLYVDLDPSGSVVEQTTRIERVPIAANLRLTEIDESFATDSLASQTPPHTAALQVLWKLAQYLSDQRGKSDVMRIDYAFRVDWTGEGGNGEP